MTFVREEDITCFRVTTPEVDRNTGRQGPDVEVEVILKGNIQPSVGEDLDNLPDGALTKDVKVVFLHEGLNTDDIVMYKGNRYVVKHEDDWDSASATIRHYMYYVWREGAIV